MGSAVFNTESYSNAAVVCSSSLVEDVSLSSGRWPSVDEAVGGLKPAECSDLLGSFGHSLPAVPMAVEWDLGDWEESPSASDKGQSGVSNCAAAYYHLAVQMPTQAPSDGSPCKTGSEEKVRARNRRAQQAFRIRQKAKAEETEHQWMEFQCDLQMLKQTKADLAARVRRLEKHLCRLQS